MKSIPIKEVRRIVLVFDLCSSSNILESLKLNDSLAKYYGFLIFVKEFLQESAPLYKFEIYKFVGDGWILFFKETDAGKLVEFLPKLGEVIDEAINAKDFAVMETPLRIQGITCGVEVGVLRRIVMLQNREYVGRPINIACRLQGLVKTIANPANKVLVSKGAYEKIFSGIDVSFWSPKRERFSLRNIQGGREYSCVSLSLPFIELDRDDT